MAVVVEEGSRRLGLLPWPPLSTEVAAAEVAAHDDEAVDRGDEAVSPVQEELLRLDDLLSHLLLTGLGRAPASAWAEMAEVAEHAGFVRLAAPIAALADALRARADVLRWDPTPALRQARELCLLSRLASE